MHKCTENDLIIAKEMLSGRTTMEDIGRKYGRKSPSAISQIAKRVYSILLPGEERLKWLSTKTIVIEFKEVLLVKIEERLGQNKNT